MQNRVYLGTDTPVIITFVFSGEFAADGLSNFTDIKIDIGGELYTLLLNAANVVVTSNTELRLLIGTDTALTAGKYDVVITGVSATYDDGFVLAPCGSLSQVVIA